MLGIPPGSLQHEAVERGGIPLGCSSTIESGRAGRSDRPRRAERIQRTDPVRYVADRLDSSGNLSGYLGVEGEIPLLLQPGDNHIFIRCDEIPLHSIRGERKPARTHADRHRTYDPRLAL